MANRTFMYVDKNRICPTIKERISEYKEIMEVAGHDEYLDGKVSALTRVLNEITDGLYDWQPAD